MGVKTPIDKLDTAIKKILDEYADDVTHDLHSVAVKVGKEGVKALKSESQKTFNTHSRKPYYKSWAMLDQSTRVTTDVILHSNTPGLPHLLEYGHAKRKGGRVAGRPHISKVEKEIVEKFEKDLKAKL